VEMSILNKFFGHLHTVNRHRWEVFKLSIKAGIPLRGLVHDLSKYSIEEFGEAMKYYADGKYSPNLKCKQTIGYSRAWLHHKGRNKHHYEYWYDPAAPEPTPIIPFKYMLEMICDRISASKVYGKDKYNNKYALDYFHKEEKVMKLNPKLKKFLIEVLTELSNEGEKIINKKHLKELYDKNIK
jgi:hypothetical protein